MVVHGDNHVLHGNNLIRQIEQGHLVGLAVCHAVETRIGKLSGDQDISAHVTVLESEIGRVYELVQYRKWERDVRHNQVQLFSNISFRLESEKEIVGYPDIDISGIQVYLSL